MTQRITLMMKRFFVSSFSLLLVAALCIPTTAHAAPTSADKRAEAEAALTNLKSMQEDLSEASNQYYKALEEQEEAQGKMDEAQGRIDAADKEITEGQGKLGTRARSMYRNGSTSFLDVLLGSTSFQEFVTNWDLLNQMNKSDAELVGHMKQLSLEIQSEKDEYAKQEGIAAEKAAQAKEVKEQAESTVTAMQATYDSLSAEAAELLEQERQAQVAREQAAAQQVLDNAARSANNNGGSGSTNSGSSSYSSSSSGSGGGSTSTSAPINYNGSTADVIISAAQSKLGSPYVWGGKGPNSFDCSGFVAWCYAQAGYSVPSYTGSLMGLSRVSDPQPGDIAVNSGHTGIYVGGGQMIHASTYGVGVIYGPVQGGMIFVRGY